MSLLRRIRRNTAKTTIARGGHRLPLSYAKRCLDGMTRGLLALSSVPVPGDRRRGGVRAVRAAQRWAERVARRVTRRAA
jgi:hypothetical protein